MTFNDLIPSLIRTYVPIIVGALAGWLAALNINVTDDTKAALVLGISGLASAAYYTAIRLLEKRWPWFGSLLGLAKSPDSYSKGDPIPVQSSNRTIPSYVPEKVASFVGEQPGVVPNDFATSGVVDDQEPAPPRHLA